MNQTMDISVSSPKEGTEAMLFASQERLILLFNKGEFFNFNSV